MAELGVGRTDFRQYSSATRFVSPRTFAALPVALTDLHWEESL